ncbi:MAG: carbonic anhydrase family protein [Rickettsiales bacterium]
MRFLCISLFSFLSILIVPAFCMADDGKAPVWTYDDDLTGQEDWGSIAGYETCTSGMEQSPINISHTKLSNLPKLNFKYSKATGLLNITNKSFIMEVAEGGILIDGKNKYSLQSVEIHSPSGHRIKEAFYPLEMHLIHKDKKGDLLIVAVFADIGDSNKYIDDILKHSYSKEKHQFTADISSLLANSDSYYSYRGSLPYPPCTENVEWKIMKTPISISRQQLSSIVKFIGRNTRLAQPVYMREISEGE